MSKKQKVFLACLALVVAVLNVLIVMHRGAGDRSLELHMEIQSEQKAVVQVYYSSSQEFSEAMSQQKEYTDNGEKQSLEFSISPDTVWLRIDLGDRPRNMRYRG